jgi:predicted TIM-barrel fold metal-dependent hydrolase
LVEKGGKKQALASTRLRRLIEERADAEMLRQGFNAWPRWQAPAIVGVSAARAGQGGDRPARPHIAEGFANAFRPRCAARENELTKDKLPNFLQQLSSDEYDPQAYSEADRTVVARTAEALREKADRYRLDPDAWSLASKTAAGLISLNQEYGEEFFRVEPTAVLDAGAAAASFAGTGVVVDVQTHFVAPHCKTLERPEYVINLYREIMPSWWTEIDDLTSFDLASYIRNVFLETEVGVAILTSNPGIGDRRMLWNDEMAASRALINGFAGSQRLLNHAVVHADIAEELATMSEWLEELKPSAWKVYTPGRMSRQGWTDGWMLDDEVYGIPFLERVRKLGLKRLCIHKGISMLADNGSPADIGPAAVRFPDIQFLVYHSGYEFLGPNSPPEGAYTEATAMYGINRLIHSCVKAGLGSGANVYPEIGSTWFAVIRRPIEACHVIGKLIKYFGEDNVIWGSDSIWYGSQQPLIDAFRSLQIPDWMCEEFGYAKLTPAVREKVLGGNAARVYGIDTAKVAAEMSTDDLHWGKLLLDELSQNGFSGLR